MKHDSPTSKRLIISEFFLTSYVPTVLLQKSNFTNENFLKYSHVSNHTLTIFKYILELSGILKKIVKGFGVALHCLQHQRTCMVYYCEIYSVVLKAPLFPIPNTQKKKKKKEKEKRKKTKKKEEKKNISTSIYKSNDQLKFRKYFLNRSISYLKIHHSTT